MNVDTGELYYTMSEIESAKERGENVVEFDAPTKSEAEKKAERHKRILGMFPTLEYSPMEYARMMDKVRR